MLQLIGVEPLASRLREDEIYVFGFGEHKAPVSFRRACDDFLLTENLSGEQSEEPEMEAPNTTESKTGRKPPEIVRLLRRAWDQVQDDQGWANLSPAGSFLKRAKPDFDPRTYGAKKFSDLFVDLGDYFGLRKQPSGAGVKAYRPVKGERK